MAEEEKYNTRMEAIMAWLKSKLEKEEDPKEKDFFSTPRSVNIALYGWFLKIEENMSGSRGIGFLCFVVCFSYDIICTN